jgi:hypothetical protein
VNEDTALSEVQTLRSIHTAVVGLAFAVLTGALIVADGPLVFPMFVLTVSVLVGSVVTR